MMTDYKPLTIVDIIEETADCKTFVLACSNEGLLRYTAGQFVTLVFNTPFGEKRRSYSFSSAPALAEPMSITIKRVPNGEFSRQLINHAIIGNVLQASSINGLFTLPEDTSTINQVFFFAAGSGITPCYSIIKTILAKHQHQKVVLVYSNKKVEDTIFYQALQQLTIQYADRFVVHYLFSSHGTYQNRLGSWLLQQLLQQYLQTTLSKALFYMCGPFDYMQTISITLLSQGVAAKQIKKEQFSSLPRTTKPIPPDTAAHIAYIQMNGITYALPVQYPQTLLAAAKANHIAIPYSCEAGRCGSCAATCTSGNIWMAYNEVLLDEEVAAGRILCCQAYIVNGDASITL